MGTLTPTLSRGTGEGERAADEVPDKVGDKVGGSKRAECSWAGGEEFRIIFFIVL
jgi:hypothetical protein